MLCTLPSNIKYTQWEIASNYNQNIAVGPYYSAGEELNKTGPAGTASFPFSLKAVRRKLSNGKWRVQTFLYMEDGSREWLPQYENTDAMTPLGIGQFCLGNDADSYSEYFPGKIFLNDCYLVQENPNAKQPMGKYKLMFIDEPHVINDPLPEITATISTPKNAAERRMAAKLTATNPSGAKVGISVKSATAGFGTFSDDLPRSKAVTFDAGKTQTKNVWFRLSRSGYQTTTYKVALKQTATGTTTSSWGSWSYWSNGVKNYQAAEAVAYIQNTYGDDAQVETFQGNINGSSGWHVRYRLRTYSTTYSYSYKGTITKLST